jgi:hypothetical protein
VAHRFEPGEVAIERHHLAAVLGGDGRDGGVCDEVAEGVRLITQLAQQREVAWAGADLEVERLRGGRLDERERLRPRRRDFEDPAVGGEPEEGRPHERWNGEALVAGEHGVEPAANRCVIGMVASVCREDHVDVQKEHASAPVVDGHAFVERLEESSIRAKVDAGPRARSVVEHRDRRPLTGGASVTQRNVPTD